MLVSLLIRWSYDVWQALLRRVGLRRVVGPVVLPPDGELKHLRFTPVIFLCCIPKGQIVELSLDEVKQLYPKVAGKPLKCPRCGAKPVFLFWYQYGLTPNFSKEAAVYMRCQSCGDDEYL